MKHQLGGHWLAFLWATSQPEPLVEAVKKARGAGATVFELIYHVLNGLSAEQTAAALKEGGVNDAVMCVFFPPGDNAECPFGDPLSDDPQLVETAVATFKKVIQFMVELQGHGINIDLIVGPSCFVLTKNYQVDWATRKERMMSFYTTLDDDLQNADIDVAVELLREEEDQVFETVEQWHDAVTTLNGELVSCYGEHYDTFHMDQRGFDQVKSIALMGDSIYHLHANGTGRRPAGGEGDEIDWSGIHAALVQVGFNGVITNEPFCDLVRNECPALGDGLPPAAEEPGGILKTRETLETVGFTFDY